MYGVVLYLHRWCNFNTIVFAVYAVEMRRYFRRGYRRYLSNPTDSRLLVQAHSFAALPHDITLLAVAASFRDTCMRI